MKILTNNRTMLTLGEAHMRAFWRACYDDTKRQYAVLDYYHEAGVNRIIDIEIEMKTLA